MTDAALADLVIGSERTPAIDLWSLDPAVIHLNHGSFGGVPRQVQAEQNNLRASMDSAPVDWFSTLPGKIRRARHDLAALFSVDPGTVALVSNASAAATCVFNAQPMRTGMNVLVTDHGYGAVSMGAARLAKRWGGQLITVHIPLNATAEEATAAVLGRVTDNVGLVVIDHITSSTARALPAQEITDALKGSGTPVLVDGAHVPGLYNEWVGEGRWDYWIGNLHKFFCAPRGAALLIAGTDVATLPIPLIDSWGAPLTFPESFDIQGTLDLTAYLAAKSSWDLIEEIWGWDTVHRHMAATADYAERRVADAFHALTGENHLVDVGQSVQAMRLIRLPDGLIYDHDSADVVRDRFVAETGSEAAFTEFDGQGYLRLSTHAYTTTEHIDIFADTLVPLIWQWAQERRKESAGRAQKPHGLREKNHKKRRHHA